MMKPLLFVFVIVGVLQFTGQLGPAGNAGQTAMLHTGIFDAEAQNEEGAAFDLNFEAYTVDGKPLDKATLKNKVIFLNLWATWCGPCRAEMPTIQQLYDQTDKANVVFVILSLDRGPTAEQKVRDYITKSNFNFPVYILKGQPTSQLAVPSIPTTYVISKKGKIMSTEVGMTNFATEEFKKYLEKLAIK